MSGLVAAGLGLCAVTAEDQGGHNHTDRAEAARRLFGRHCVKCHGEDFTGRTFRGSDRHIPDFTDRAWQRSRTDAQLLVSIRDGKGEQMPPFDDQLKDAQRRDLVALIRDANPDHPAPAEAADFERRYRELREQLEALRRQYRELAPAPAKPATRDQ
jgi:mono/diheme cytochrome c family protein